MSIESEVREEIRHFTASAIESIVGAVEREQARQRVEACEEQLVAEEMQRRLRNDPHFVWFRRWRIAKWRRKARQHASRCFAQKMAGDKLACLLCEEMDRRLSEEVAQRGVMT